MDLDLLLWKMLVDPTDVFAAWCEEHDSELEYSDLAVAWAIVLGHNKFVELLRARSDAERAARIRLLAHAFRRRRAMSSSSHEIVAALGIKQPLVASVRRMQQRALNWVA